MAADLGYSYEGLSDQEKLTCRVCGLVEPAPYFPYGEDGFSWEWDTCDCCGVTHGYQDITVADAQAYRGRWLTAGAPWKHPKYTPQPKNWDVQEQLKNVPLQFR